MANIAISELASEATTLNDNDLLLVSKNNGTSYTSAKMKASVLKNSSGGGTCNFSSDLIQTACETAIINKNVATTNTIETAISQTFNENNTINETIVTNSIKGNFIDWSQTIDFKTTLTSESLPFDCLLLWSTIPSRLDINFFDAKSVLSNSATKQCYLECGSNILVTPNQSSCYIVPLSYGSIQLDYITNDIIDWLSDGEGRSKIDEYFDNIQVIGGNSSNHNTNVQYTKMTNIDGLSCMYWSIRCQPKTNVMIGSGGKKTYSKFYTSKYYVSGNYIHATSYTNGATAMTNSGKRVLVKANQYLTMNFIAYQQTSKVSSTADFFNNITWAPLSDFQIA